MSISVRISDREYEAAKKTAKAEHRSIQGQVEFWVKIGRCALDNPDLPIEMIKELLSTDWNDHSDTTRDLKKHTVKEDRVLSGIAAARDTGDKKTIAHHDDVWE